jgi:single-strand DNA-binding protein
MSQSVNKVILVGFLGAGPELKFTAQGKAMATFGLAVNERWKDSEGTPQESVQWFRIVAFGRLTEICGEYLTKGRQVFIEGKVAMPYLGRSHRRAAKERRSRRP